MEIIKDIVRYPDQESFVIDVFKENETPHAVEHLPAIYHDEAEDVQSPLWALLHWIEYTFGGLTDIIENVDQFLDVYKTPAETSGGSDKIDFLGWLGSWVAMTREKKWNENKRRYATRNATEIYKYRGTKTGLAYLLTLTFDIEVDIKEWAWPKGMQIGVRNSIGVDTVLHERPNLNYCFVVIWEPSREDREQVIRTKIKKIRAVLDLEKPGHTLCYFYIKENGGL